MEETTVTTTREVKRKLVYDRQPLQGRIEKKSKTAKKIACKQKRGKQAPPVIKALLDVPKKPLVKKARVKQQPVVAKKKSLKHRK